jgi:opacity protein-like surface antigen
MLRISGRFVLPAGVLMAAVLASASPAAAVGINPQPGDIVFANATARSQGNGGGVLKTDPRTGRRLMVSDNVTVAGFPQFDLPVWLAIEADGNIVTTGTFVQSDQKVYQGVIRIDPTNGRRSAVSLTTSTGVISRGGGPGFNDPQGIAVESTGDLIVVNGATGDILRIDPLSGNRQILSTNAVQSPSTQFDAAKDISFTANSDLVVMDSAKFPNANGAGGALFSVNVTTGVHTLISGTAPAQGTLFDAPFGLAVAPLNLVYAGNRGPSRENIDSVTLIGGTRTTVSDNFFPPGGYKYHEINDLAMAQRGKTIISTQFGTAIGQVLRTRPSGGKRLLVTDDVKSPGLPSTGRPWGVGVYPITARKFVLGKGSVIVQDRAAAAGTTKAFSYTLGKNANAVITIARRTGKTFKTVGTLRQSAKKGANSLPFDGRVGKSKLKPGTYRAILTASDSENESVPVSVDFKVK